MRLDEGIILCYTCLTCNEFFIIYPYYTVQFLKEQHSLFFTKTTNSRLWENDAQSRVRLANPLLDDHTQTFKQKLDRKQISSRKKLMENLCMSVHEASRL